MFFYNKILLFCSERLVVNTLEVFAFRGFLDDGVGIPYIIYMGCRMSVQPQM